MSPDYWQRKIALFLHDPVDKAFRVPGHEERAEEIARLLHQSVPAKEDYQAADCIASGLTRAALPGHSADRASSGSVEFAVDPVLTHPLVKGETLSFSPVPNPRVGDIHEAVLALLRRDVGDKQTVEELKDIPESERPLNGFFDRKNTPEEWARALFFYLFFAFRKRLRQEKAGMVGAMWDFIPADTRMPDHSLWHHCGLTSAVGSSMKEDPDREVSLAVFAVSPVQPFIARARKLRDHWVGSVVLSYLAFSGIRRVAQTLGPDHVVYPSLQDQALVEAWIGKDFHLGRFLEDPDEDLAKISRKGRSIASFPNKFVFLCPKSRAGEVLRDLADHVRAEWMLLAKTVREYLSGLTGSGKAMETLFDHQVSDYWQFSWASARLAGHNDRDALRALIPAREWSVEAETVEDFSRAFGNTGVGVARLYGATHSLIQRVLASAKLKPERVRGAQQGEKCPLCGEHEVLHDFFNSGETSARDYAAAVKDFWGRLRDAVNPGGNRSQVGKNERLCAVCAVKRFLPAAMRKFPEEALQDVFQDADRFPSTTEMATAAYREALRTRVAFSTDEEKRLLDLLHDAELESFDDEHSAAVRELVKKGEKQGVKLTDRDKYYAVLLMDGDRMGDLINGETLNAAWEDVLHPELRNRFADPAFAPGAPLRSRLKGRRTLNPAVHAAISEGLNSFARFAVAPLIEQAGGRLIYAGGDDVCAVLPLNGALEAAERLRKAYTLGFVRYTGKGAQAVPKDETVDACSKAKIGMHLGGGAEGISISAAVVIAHHKAPLREVFRDAHALLDEVAKKKTGRNALAIRLKKRSGGDRDFYCRWDEENPFVKGETVLESFQAVMAGVGDELGTRLLYRLAGLENAILPLAGDLAANGDKILRIFDYEVGHSGKSKAETKEKFSGRLAGICLSVRGGELRRKPDGSLAGEWFNPEAAVIARFLASGRSGEGSPEGGEQ